MLDQKENLTTSRLSARTTSPETPLPKVIASFGAEQTANAKTKRGRPILIGGAFLVLLVCGIIVAVAYIQLTSHSRTADDAALFYPGSQTIVDLSSGDGRAIQLQTNDSLDQVIAWYEKSIKPTKTMRLTSTSVILKNENVTTTLATEAGKTNILIKRVK
jgi:hypothetical protein